MGPTNETIDGPPIRLAAVGLDHIHVLAQVAALVGAGAELAAIHPPSGPLAPLLIRAYPDAAAVADLRSILEDERIDVLVTAAVPDERADLAIAAMRHGKDVLCDKPGAVTLEQLERIRVAWRETGRQWSVFFSERVESAATLRAVELVEGGAIGRPIQTLGVGPHRLGLLGRPPWFFDPARSGGILADLASHQVDQFLVFTGARNVEIASATVANQAHPEHPLFEDFGEVLLRGDDRVTGYARVDWFTPDGLPSWGDVRLTILGTEGTIEVRKNLDLAGREGAEHLFLVDREGVRHIPCAGAPKPFARDWLRDVRRRTQTALPVEHCLRASEIAVRAQQQAKRLRVEPA